MLKYKMQVHEDSIIYINNDWHNSHVLITIKPMEFHDFDAYVRALEMDEVVLLRWKIFLAQSVEDITTRKEKAPSYTVENAMA